MRKQKVEQKMASYGKIFMAGATVLSLCLTGCVKKRPDQFPDGTVNSTISRSDLVSAQMSIRTAAEPVQLSAADSLRAENQDLVAVASYNGPSQYASMFKNLKIHGEPNTTYAVHFAVDRHYVTAYMDVPQGAQLSPFEQELAGQFAKEFRAKTRATGRGLMLVSAQERTAKVLRVPLFQYKISKYGTVDHIKNDLNQDTNKLRVDTNDWAVAPDVVISTREADRQNYRLGPQDSAQGRVFVASALNGKIFSKNDLQNELQISTSDLDPSTMYYSQVDSKKMSLYRIIKSPEAGMSTDEATAIKNGDPSLMGDAGVLPCTDLARASIGDSSGSCFMALKYQFDVTPVTVSRISSNAGQSADASLSATLQYTSTDSADPNSPLIEIASRPSMKDLWEPDAGDFLDPSKALVVDQFKNREFLMTRTLTDSPYVFGDTFLGNAGKMQIVRFIFEKNRVRIVRSKPRVEHLGLNQNDLDTLMSFPAKYAVLSYVANDGTRLATPVKKDANYDTPGAIAIIDWTKNQMPELNSPLDYYDLDQCFDGEREKDISQVDNRPDQGILNFTYTRTYQGSRTSDCAGIYANTDYFGKYPQTNFRFAERISFRAYNGADDKKILLNLPFDVQEQLGFGLFTQKVDVPDKYGNVDRVGSEEDVASLWDLSNGKTVNYVLAGLPSDSDPQMQRIGLTREDIIKAVREVVADWNKAFKEAFQGTPRECNAKNIAAGTAFCGKDGNIVQLTVEGEDAPKGHLGDIQRNTIYWVQKQLNSSIFGLAQAQPNPRSGVIETSNVYVYGGNFIGAVPYYREMAEAVDHYHEIVDPYEKVTQAVMAKLQEQQQSQAGAAASDPSAASSGAASGAANSSAAPRMEQERMDIAQALPMLTQDSSRMESSLLSQGDQWMSEPSYLTNESRFWNSFPQARFQKGVAIEKIVDEARSSGALNDPNLLEAIVDENLSAVDPNATPDQIARAKQMAAHLRLKSQILRRMEKLGICAYDRGHLDVSPVAGEDPTKWSDKEWVIRILKPTLAHEMGHTFGLRHNFQGSYDKADWLFPSELHDGKKHVRQYSSIMDYMEDDHLTYEGLGPYDVAAIRAAYTGMIQLKNGNLVSLNQIKKASGARNWTDFSRMDASQIRINGQALKRYDFCTDEDLGGDPTCRQFDKGTTPLEIVNHDIDEYNAYYALRNFPTDRVSFTDSSTGGYVSRLFSTFLPIRTFLEETVYQQRKLYDRYSAGLIDDQEFQKKLNPYVQAVVRGLFFFNQVIRTPDAPNYAATNESRFVPDVDSNGIPHLVERKALEDIYASNDESNNLLVRGDELDKIIATIMLTSRSFGIPRYLRDSILTSYPEFEQELIQGNDPMSRPSVELLSEIISSDINPAVWSGGGLVPTSQGFSTTTTDSMRWVAAKGAMMNLDTGTSMEGSNPSVFFQVLSSAHAPEKTVAVQPPGSQDTAEGILHYWAPGAASASQSVIDTINGLAKSVAAEPTLKPLLQKWLALKMPTILEETGFMPMEVQDPQINVTIPLVGQSTDQTHTEAAAPAPKPADPELVLSQQIDSELAKLPASAGATRDSQGNVHPLTTKFLEQELGLFFQRAQVLAELKKAAQSGDAAEALKVLKPTGCLAIPTPQEQASAQLVLKEGSECLKNRTQWEATNIPVVGILFTAFNSDPQPGDTPDKGVPLIAQARDLYPGMPLDMTQGLMLDGIQTLNQIFVQMHPEVVQDY